MKAENIFVVRGLLLRNSYTEHMFGLNPQWYQHMPFECEVKAPNLHTAIMCVEGKYGDNIVISTQDCGVKFYI